MEYYVITRWRRLLAHAPVHVKRGLMTTEKATGRFSRDRFVFRYGSAVAGASAAFVLRAALQLYFEHRAFTVIYVPVVVFAAFAGGRGPAILATVLCLGG